MALARRVGTLLNMPLDTEPLAEAAIQWEQGISQLLESSEELGEYVRRLEAAADEGAGLSGQESIPSADAIADEVERFLRDQGRGTP
jgi:hypothetical protein